jgi:hypothetical protein
MISLIYLFIPFIIIGSGNLCSSSCDSLIKGAISEGGESTVGTQGYDGRHFISANSNDTLSLRTFIWSDTTYSWTAILQNAIDSSKGKVLVIPPGVYHLTAKKPNPYLTDHQYCLDLKTGNNAILNQGTLKLHAGQQTDADGAVDVIIFQFGKNIKIEGGVVDGNAEQQNGWTKGYAQVDNGILIRGYKSNSRFDNNNNITIKDILLRNHYSNPINIDEGRDISIENVNVYATGEGIQVIYADNVLVRNCYIYDSSAVSVGDGIELSACQHFLITDCTVLHHHGGSAFDLYGSSKGKLTKFYVDDANDGVATSNHVNGEACDSIIVSDGVMKHLRTSTGAFEGAFGTITYDNLTIDSCQYGFQFRTYGVGAIGGIQYMTNCKTTNSVHQGALITGSRHVVIDKCTFSGSGASGLSIYRTATGDAIRIDVRNSEVINNATQGFLFQNNGDTAWHPVGTIRNTRITSNGAGAVIGGGNTDISGIRIITDSATSVPWLESASTRDANITIELTPNPTRSKIMIHVRRSSIMKEPTFAVLEIVDVNGKVLCTVLHNPTEIVKNDWSYEWDSDAQPDGLYFVKISTDKGVYMRKFIVLK